MSWRGRRTGSAWRGGRYNDAIQDYNTFIGQFPNSIWAGMAGFHNNDAYFKASAGGAAGAEREVLRISCQLSQVSEARPATRRT